MHSQSPLSPVQRGKNDDAHEEAEASWFHKLNAHEKAFEVLKRTASGVYNAGFLHAGNFAYMALIAVFAFVIVVAGIGGALGRTDFGLEFIQSFLSTLPPHVSAALRGPVESALTARSGPVLWMSALIGLWTVGSLIESIREMQHAAYGTQSLRPFWHYRLGSLIIIVGAVLLAMLTFSAQILFVTLTEFVARFVPMLEPQSLLVFLSRIVPFAVLFGTIYTLFYQTIPHQYRRSRNPKWPGALLVAFWWLAATALLPLFFTYVADYSLTYGTLAGAIITLIFFYIIGIGMVTGAQLNAALVNVDENG